MFMAGHVAETMVFDELSTGAVERHRARDGDRATHGHRVRHERTLGPLAFGKKDELDLPRPGDQRAAQLSATRSRIRSTRRSAS